MHCYRCSTYAAAWYWWHDASSSSITRFTCSLLLGVTTTRAGNSCWNSCVLCTHSFQHLLPALIGVIQVASTCTTHLAWGARRIIRARYKHPALISCSYSTGTYHQVRLHSDLDPPRHPSCVFSLGQKSFKRPVTGHVIHQNYPVLVKKRVGQACHRQQ
jgi:hypothetical protein